MLTAVGLGLLLGLRHAFDPDHVAAVATLVARHRSPWSASWVGASWAAGHALTILVVGGAIVALRVTVPERFGLAAEVAVGVLLVSLGLANLRAARDGLRGRAPGDEQRRLRGTLARSGAIGLVHGLAGSGALALLATAAMPTAASALSYLLVFGIGNALAMVAFSLVLAAPLAGARAGAAWRARLTMGTGLASLACGVWLIHRAALVEGLLA